MDDYVLGMLVGLVTGSLVAFGIGGTIGERQGVNEGRCIELSEYPYDEAVLLCDDEDYRKDILDG